MRNKQSHNNVPKNTINAPNRQNKPDPKKDTVTVQGLSVEVRDDRFNDALRKFKKKVQEDGRLQTVKNREEYIKPCVKRNRAAAAARSRHLKQLAKENGSSCS